MYCNWHRRGGSPEEDEEAYRAPARDRLQHAGFDHMAPPGTGNTKPCDYPKHTGSKRVSEPTALDCVRFCTDILPSWPFLPEAPLPSPAVGTGSRSALTLVFTRKESDELPTGSRQLDTLTNNALGTFFLWF